MDSCITCEDNMLSYSSKQDIITLIKNGFVVEQSLRQLIQNIPLEYIHKISDERCRVYFPFYGRIHLVEFLNRVFSLEKLPSKDRRYRNAFEDIHNHVFNGDLRGEDWIYSDDRLNLMNELNLVRFILTMFREDVREELSPWKMLLDKFNNILRQDNYQLKMEIDSNTNFEICTIIRLGEICVDQPQLKKKNVIKQHGVGSYAIVYTYEDQYYNRMFAVKRLLKESTLKELERFKKEFYYLNKYRHPNIIEVYSYQNDYNQYIMEYMDYTLYDYLRGHNNYKDSDEFLQQMHKRKSIINQITEGLLFIHSKHVFHRDISLNNVLLKDYGDVLVVKLSDFGLIKTQDSRLTTQTSRFKGSLNDESSLKRKGFENYNLLDEIYALTYLFSLIITGKTEVTSLPEYILEFRDRGAIHDKPNSFKEIEEIRIAALEAIDQRISQSR